MEEKKIEEKKKAYRLLQIFSYTTLGRMALSLVFKLIKTRKISFQMLKSTALGSLQFGVACCLFSGI